MIPKDSFITYAQYHEDLVLKTLFEDVKNGFYVDVGANHEEYHSVTKFFYKKGWRGINIEPIHKLATEIKKKRSRDLVLSCAVAEKEGEMTFREYPNEDGLSTMSEQSKKENEKTGLKYKDYTVKVDTLRNIFDKQKVNNIDFIKIDVEGFEREVIKSNNWKKYRPKVICIEANHRSTDWQNFLVKEKYKLKIFDGLNEYYLSEEAEHLFDKFAERAAINAHNAIRQHHHELWDKDLKHIDELREHMKKQDKLIQAQDKEINNLKVQLKAAEKYSLKRVKHILNKSKKH